MASVSGTVLSGRYKLSSKLGSGGMSTVYLAQDEVLDRPVAVKLLHREISEEADQLERFRREARAAARLSHPNLVGVIDAGEDEGRPYIVFEYVEGDTLKKLITDNGGLEVDEAVAYAIEIGRGLIAAHGRKLIHRDVKPQNVLIAEDGRAKVTDFGIARSLEGEGMTATGRVLGTTDYVSPEQAMGEDVDERSDVYSLGIVLYEMLTGDVPFRAETQVGVAMKHVNEPLPDVLVERPEVSAAVASVVDHSTTKDPRDRYNSVGEMVRDLEATLEVEAARGGGPSGGQATTVLDSVKKSRRGLSGRVSGMGVVLGMLGLAVAAAALIFVPGQLDNLGSDDDPEASGGTRIALADDSVTDFDPFGGDGEHPEETPLAVDGDPTGTAWSTEGYQGVFDKEGVGIYVDAGKPVEATGMELRMTAGGADVEVRAPLGAAEPPEDLEGWTVVGQAAGAGTKQSIELTVDEPSRFYLVWLTKLPASEDSGELQAEISDIRLIGPSELVRARVGMLLEREADQPVAQLRVGDPAGLEELGVDAGLGEAGDRVELVDQDGLVVDEEVAAPEARASAEGEDLQRELAHPLRGRLADPRRDAKLHPPRLVLRLVVVPVGVGEDLTGHGGDRLGVAENGALDLRAGARRLDDHLRVVAAGELHRRSEVVERFDLC